MSDESILIYSVSIPCAKCVILRPMKTISISFIRCWLLLSGFMLPHVLWAQRLNFRQADSLLVTHNHDLKTARWDVSSAEGQLAQSRRYDNPTVNMMYNVPIPTPAVGLMADTTASWTCSYLSLLPLADSMPNKSGRTKPLRRLHAASCVLPSVTCVHRPTPCS